MWRARARARANGALLGTGPGAIKGPVGAAAQAEDSDVSDELGEEPDCSGEQPARGSAAEPSEKAACPAHEFHEEETAIGLDRGTHSGVVQHVSALKAQMDLLRDNAKNSAAQLDEHSAEKERMSAATAQAASREVRSPHHLRLAKHGGADSEA